MHDTRFAERSSTGPPQQWLQHVQLHHSNQWQSVLLLHCRTIYTVFQCIGSSSCFSVPQQPRLSLLTQLFCTQQDYEGCQVGLLEPPLLTRCTTYRGTQAMTNLQWPRKTRAPAPATRIAVWPSWPPVCEARCTTAKTVAHACLQCAVHSSNRTKTKPPKQL